MTTLLEISMSDVKSTYFDRFFFSGELKWFLTQTFDFENQILMIFNPSWASHHKLNQDRTCPENVFSQKQKCGHTRL